jgi:hypothetical protein
MDETPRKINLRDAVESAFDALLQHCCVSHADREATYEEADAVQGALTERTALRAALTERDARIARIREKVEYLYSGYVSGEAIRVTLDKELVVDAVWEARLFELDAMLSRALNGVAYADDRQVTLLTAGIALTPSDEALHVTVTRLEK